MAAHSAAMFYFMALPQVVKVAGTSLIFIVMVSGFD